MKKRALFGWVGFLCIVTMSVLVLQASSNVAVSSKAMLGASTAAPNLAVNLAKEMKREHWWTFKTKPYKFRFKGLVKKQLYKRHKKLFRKNGVVVPDTFDLRPKLSMIENQGNCGSCWCFSLTAYLRDVWVLAGKDPGRLSQQYCVDCAPGYGCNGGYFDGADAFKKPKGSPSWNSYPYVAKTQRCKSSTPTASIRDWHMVGGNNVPTSLEIEQAVLAYGPLSITVAAGAGPWEGYDGGGVYNACTRGSTDHMINIVGWNNRGCKHRADGSLDPACKATWIVRNSWGIDWGENGYMETLQTDSSGRKCNNVAEEASFFEIDAPVPPAPAPVPTGLVLVAAESSIQAIWASVNFPYLIAIAEGTSVDCKGGTKATENSFIFENLKSGTQYAVGICTTNGSDVSGQATAVATTLTPAQPGWLAKFFQFVWALLFAWWWPF